MTGHSDSYFPSGVETHANGYRFEILTLNIHDAVTILVYHMLRAAPGPANTEEVVKCPVLHLVAVFHATNVALRPSPVNIDAPGTCGEVCAEDIATNAPMNLMLEWTFSR